jgi:hypothetical protein
MWQQEIVLWASFVKVSEIHAHPYAAILLRQRNNVGHPISLFYCFDETHFQLFDSLFFYLAHPLGLHAAEFLFDGLDLG